MIPLTLVVIQLAIAASFVITDFNAWSPLSLSKNGQQLCYIDITGCLRCPYSAAAGVVVAPLLTPSRFVSIAGGVGDGGSYAARRADGTVAGFGDWWGYSSWTFASCSGPTCTKGGPNAITGATAYTSVAMGGRCGFGLLPDGTMVASGYNAWGQCVAQAGTWAFVAAQFVSTCAIRATTGATVCWGEDHGTIPAGPFVAVTKGDKNNCGLLVDGTVQCWGWSSIANPPNKYRMVAIDYGSPAGACGILADYTLKCWGAAASYTLPSGQFFFLTSCGSAYCGVTFNQTIACWGNTPAFISAAAAGVTVQLPAALVSISAVLPEQPYTQCVIGSTSTPTTTVTPSSTASLTPSRMPSSTATPTLSMPSPTATISPSLSPSVLCPAGTFAPSTGTMPCQQCPGGHYCPPGTSSWANRNCGRGKYCPFGSAAPLSCPYQVPPSGGWGALRVQGPAFLVETAYCLNQCFWNYTSGDGVLSRC